MKHKVTDCKTLPQALREKHPDFIGQEVDF